MSRSKAQQGAVETLLVGGWHERQPNFLQQRAERAVQ